MYKNGEDNAYKFIKKKCDIAFYNSTFHSFVTKMFFWFFFFSFSNFLSGAKYLRLSDSSSFENKFGFESIPVDADQC